MIEITAAARDRIREALARTDPPRDALRVEVRIENGSFAYKMSPLSADEASPDERVIEQDGFRLVLDGDSASRLEGTRVDYEETLLARGFRFDNPNQPQSPTLPTGSREDLQGPVPDRLRMLLDTEINPAIAAHGGRVTLVEVRDGKAYLAFGGGCHGCGMVDVTLKQGIETRIREVVPEIIEVVDTTDHASGENPYYH
jgi:Fe/S biogenesis protein NfuA